MSHLVRLCLVVVFAWHLSSYASDPSSTAQQELVSDSAPSVTLPRTAADADANQLVPATVEHVDGLDGSDSSQGIGRVVQLLKNPYVVLISWLISIVSGSIAIWQYFGRRRCRARLEEITVKGKATYTRHNAGTININH